MSQGSMSPKRKLELASDEQVAFVRRQLGVTEQDIKEAVKSLRSWLQNQPHLPDAIDDSRIERMFINRKCSMQRTKEALDAYFSLKHKAPELLMNRDPSSEAMATVSRYLLLGFVPGLTKEGYRVLFLKYYNPDVKLYVPIDTFKKILMIADVCLAEDYSLGDVIIYDMKHVNTEHVIKTGLNTLRAAELAWRTAYSRRMKAIHIINISKVVDKILVLARAVMPKKIVNRITLHSPGSRTLFDHLAPEFVPSDLGGTALTSQELAEAAEEKMRSQRECFLAQDAFLSDESKRPPGTSYVDDFFGVDGSFKKLSID